MGAGLPAGAWVGSLPAGASVGTRGVDWGTVGFLELAIGVEVGLGVEVE